MIDATKTQIVNPMVECWAKDKREKSWTKGLLVYIDIEYREPYCVLIEKELYIETFEQITFTDPYTEKERFMTPFEAQRFARELFLEKPNARVRCNAGEWTLPMVWSYVAPIKEYEWADFTDSGEMIGEPKKFVVEE